MSKPFIQKQYFALALDPIHVGTGGYRLGRVDNTIVREPGNNIPKIPGSSISGVCRAFTAIHPEVNKYPKCAGKGGDQGSDHCGKSTCPVCVGFGFSNGKAQPPQSFQGMVQFSDARILLLPVHSLLGPVWVTSPSILKEHGISLDLSDWKEFRSFGLPVPEGRLNFGWLMIESDSTATSAASLGNSFSQVPKDIRDRLFLVSDKLFSRIINDNLEVRTSVAINPNTGAAEDKALFTYEAIPRATVLWFDITYNNPDNFKINNEQKIILTTLMNVQDPFRRINQNNPLDQVGSLAHYIEQGLSYIEALGLGGMNTRGFGRAKIIHGEVL